MFTHIGRMVLLVKDYDEALGFYIGKLEFTKIYDQTVSESLRLVHIGVPGQEKVGIWMLKAGMENQTLVGSQTNGEPLFVFYTDDCMKTYETLKGRGVEFMYEPESTEADVHVHFKDLYGNQIVMVQLKQ